LCDASQLDKVKEPSVLNVELATAPESLGRLKALEE
jgi:hypothetical protein